MKPTSWRTTTAGILTIVGALVGIAIQVLNGHGPDASSLAGLAAAVTAGAGLIKASDHANLPPQQ